MTSLGKQSQRLFVPFILVTVKTRAESLQVRACCLYSQNCRLTLQIYSIKRQHSICGLWFVMKILTAMATFQQILKTNDLPFLSLGRGQYPPVAAQVLGRCRFMSYVLSTASVCWITCCTTVTVRQAISIWQRALSVCVEVMWFHARDVRDKSFWWLYDPLFFQVHHTFLGTFTQIKPALGSSQAPYTSSLHDCA